MKTGAPATAVFEGLRFFSVPIVIGFFHLYVHGISYAVIFIVRINGRLYPLPMQLLDDSIDILEQLVAFDTSSHKTNKPLIAWVKAYLDRYALSVTLQDDASGSKQNLIAKIGPGDSGGIVLSGHTDVVPATASNWVCDPFRLRCEKDKLFGRGTTDMKGFLSIVLAAVPQMAKRELRQPITLALSYDEEVGCLGVPDLVRKLPPNQRVIVGEPTGLAPGIRHKGARVQTLTIKGVSVHSGTPELGVNAIGHAAQVLDGLREIERYFAQGPEDYKTVLSVSQISGGSAINIVPDHCNISWMLRCISHADGARATEKIGVLTEEINAIMKARHPQAAAYLETIIDVPPFDRGALDATFMKLTDGRKPVSLSFGTEAGVFNEAGHDVIVCGPGDMAQGHIVDEYIEIKALADGCKFIENVIEEACA